MVELLKQGNGQPLAFYKQATIIYAGLNGYLDTMPLENLKTFEMSLYEKLDTSYQELAQEMKEKKELSKEIEEGIKNLIEDTLKSM